jgi:hypothetical protein
LNAVKVVHHFLKVEDIMPVENIRVAKNRRPLNLETVLSDLKQAFPDFEALPIGESGAAILIKASTFAGARIDVQGKQILLRKKVPGAAAQIVDLVLLGTISAAKAPAVIQPLKRFLRERYAG